MRQLVTDHLHAGCGAVRVLTRDEPALIKMLAPLITFIYSPATGIYGHSNGKNTPAPNAWKCEEPQDLAEILLDKAKPEKRPHVFFLTGLDSVLQEDDLFRRMMVEAARRAKILGNLLIFVGRSEEIHEEFHDEISTLRHPLPSRADAVDLIKTVSLEHNFQIPTPTLVADTLQGLSLSQQEEALALAIVGAKQIGRAHV